jgi:pimeloyl-ACP methyl ester carboxylesterase
MEHPELVAPVREMAAANGKAGMGLLKGGGHLVNMEQPQRFTTLVRTFLHP